MSKAKEFFSGTPIRDEECNYTAAIPQDVKGICPSLFCRVTNNKLEIKQTVPAGLISARCVAEMQHSSHWRAGNQKCQP